VIRVDGGSIPPRATEGDNPKGKTMDEQRSNLKRVTDRIGRSIIEFARDQLATGNHCFHMDSLRVHVSKGHAIAPDSPGRVLRTLRQRKLIGYEIISRRDSLYQILWVAP
jgi:hypothetical protein